MKNVKGFTLVELLVSISVFGIIMTMSIPKFMGSIDRARIGAAVSEITTMKEALGLYVTDWGTYVTKAGSPCTDYDAWKSSVVDISGSPYISLPDTINFDPATFQITVTVSDYEIQITARDAKSTKVYASAEKVWY